MKCKCKILKKNKVGVIKEYDVSYNLDCTMYNGKYVITYKDWINKHNILDFDFDSNKKTSLGEVN